MVLGITFRYDFQNSAAVILKILKINKKLSKLVRISPNISFLDLNNDSKIFTRHGLYRNKLGKQLIIAKIPTYIFSAFKHKILACIPLAWYKPTERLQDENQVKNVMRNSSRLRKIPVTRSDDFLW